jgi:hypothetical protein
MTSYETYMKNVNLCNRPRHSVLQVNDLALTSGILSNYLQLSQNLKFDLSKTHMGQSLKCELEYLFVKSRIPVCALCTALKR